MRSVLENLLFIEQIVLEDPTAGCGRNRYQTEPTAAKEVVVRLQTQVIVKALVRWIIIEPIRVQVDVYSVKQVVDPVQAASRRP